ncbi:MAG: lysostaphin resistance A-like protein [Alphaproteobacteria bacterium]
MSAVPEMDWTAASMPAPRWRIRAGHAAAIFAAALALTFIAGIGGVRLWSRFVGPFPDAAIDLIGIALPALATLIAVRTIGIGGFGLAWRDFGLTRAPKRSWIVAMLVWLACLPLLAAILYATKELTGTTPIAEQTRMLPHGALDDWRITLPLGALMIFVAPFGEELLFRGILFGALRRRWRFWPCAVLAGAAFAAVHMIPAVLAPAFVLGVAFAHIYERSRSIWPAVFFHALHNALVFAASVAERRVLADILGLLPTI